MRGVIVIFLPVIFLIAQVYPKLMLIQIDKVAVNKLQVIDRLAWETDVTTGFVIKCCIYAPWFQAVRIGKEA